MKYPLAVGAVSERVLTSVRSILFCRSATSRAMSSSPSGCSAPFFSSTCMSAPHSISPCVLAATQRY
ncbi:hypothetical protein EYF80_020221 [Liparis tanakae]|uniref:Uncharacterized protein n=1 Tax=Liparis tanakae TaxID=230148 RepID=A0A4Z2HUP3_9TELE|nr:hypothetical protein EYF80_020221 [Liparis tanakae]